MNMMPIRDLLTSALRRANVSKSVNASQIVSSANEIIHRIVPEKYPTDVKAASFKDSILTINCSNSSLAQFLSDSEDVILNYVKNAYPEHKIERVRFKITKVL